MDVARDGKWESGQSTLTKVDWGEGHYLGEPDAMRVARPVRWGLAGKVQRAERLSL